MTQPLSPARRAVVVTVPALLGLAALAIDRRPWLRWGSVELTGAQVHGRLVDSLGAMVVIGTVLLLTVGALGRRLVGVLDALLGVGLVTAALAGRSAPDHLWASYGVEAHGVASSVTRWPWTLATCGVLLAAAGVLVSATASRWPARRTRTTERSVDLTDERLLWDALSRGEDPTAGDAVGTETRPGHAATDEGTSR